MIAPRTSLSDSAASRPLAVRRRLDINVKPIVLRGKQYWHLKDPLALRYWQFGAEEFFLLQQLDGSASLSKLQAQFHDQFAPRRIDTAQLQQFLGMLHREGLVFSDAPGQAETMLERRATLERKQLFGSVTNLLAIRFRGIDPEPLLSRIYPIIRSLFHPLAVGLSGLLLISAILLVLLRWPDFIARLPDSESFLSVHTFLWLAAALAITKVLHEFGHALTNKHFGGECHELGVLLLVLTPCLYCNVSDTWLVPEKWKRMAVSAAGMYVDLVLAAICTWLWWFSVPGLFHSLCFAVMVVGSIGTLFVNGNPLLRYDGYFILSDWLEIPNLKTEADMRLRHSLLRSVLGIEHPRSEENVTQRSGLLLYAIAANAYRVFVFMLVMWFIYQWFRVQRLEGIGLMLVAFIGMGAVAPLGWQLFQELNRPRQVTTKPLFRWLACVIICGAALFLLAVPLPRRVTAPVSIVPHDGHSVYVTVAGTLADSVAPGTRVTTGQQIARLENSDIDFQIVKRTAERDQLRKLCEVLQQQQIQDRRTGVVSARAQLPVARQSLQDVETQLAHRLADREQLVLRAPCDGVLVAPRFKSPANSQHELPDWHGTPLDKSNQGSFLEAGVLVGYVVASSGAEATIMLDQSDVDQVAVGQLAQIQIDESPGNVWKGTVSAIAATTAEELPPELVTKGWFGNAEAADMQVLNKSLYQAKVVFDESIATPWGSSGRAKVSVAPESLWHRATETLLRTFRFSTL
jgi:putative peptide zinc metalloprotease protein